MATILGPERSNIERIMQQLPAVEYGPNDTPQTFVTKVKMMLAAGATVDLGGELQSRRRELLGLVNDIAKVLDSEDAPRLFGEIASKIDRGASTAYSTELAVQLEAALKKRPGEVFINAAGEPQSGGRVFVTTDQKRFSSRADATSWAELVAVLAPQQNFNARQKLGEVLSPADYQVFYQGEAFIVHDPVSLRAFDKKLLPMIEQRFGAPGKEEAEAYLAGKRERLDLLDSTPFAEPLHRRAAIDEQGQQWYSEYHRKEGAALLKPLALRPDEPKRLLGFGDPDAAEVKELFEAPSGRLFASSKDLIEYLAESKTAADLAATFSPENAAGYERELRQLLATTSNSKKVLELLDAGRYGTLRQYTQGTYLADAFERLYQHIRQQYAERYAKADVPALFARVAQAKTDQERAPLREEVIQIYDALNAAYQTTTIERSKLERDIALIAEAKKQLGI